MKHKILTLRTTAKPFLNNAYLQRAFTISFGNETTFICNQLWMDILGGLTSFGWERACVLRVLEKPMTSVLSSNQWKENNQK